METTKTEEVAKIPYDYVSRFGPHILQKNSQHQEYKPLTKIQEFKLIQKLMTDIKFVLSFEDEILSDQKIYWLYLCNIIDKNQQVNIKKSLESHCITPITWLSDSELEITIHPDLRIYKKRV